MAGATPVTILLDTCALFWFAADWDKFSAAARRMVADPRIDLAVSACSAFEIGILEKRGRIQLGQEVHSWFEAVLKIGSIQVIPVTWETALASTQLPLIHGDPPDRLIIATALRARTPIVTPDAHIATYPSVTVIW